VSCPCVPLRAGQERGEEIFVQRDDDGSQLIGSRVAVLEVDEGQFGEDSNRRLLGSFTHLQDCRGGQAASHIRLGHREGSAEQVRSADVVVERPEAGRHRWTRRHRPWG